MRLLTLRALSCGQRGVRTCSALLLRASPRARNERLGRPAPWSCYAVVCAASGIRLGRRRSGLPCACAYCTRCVAWLSRVWQAPPGYHMAGALLVMRGTGRVRGVRPCWVRSAVRSACVACAALSAAERVGAWRKACTATTLSRRVGRRATPPPRIGWCGARGCGVVGSDEQRSVGASVSVRCTTCAVWRDGVCAASATLSARRPR